jgi:hypothetical protein
MLTELEPEKILTILGERQVKERKERERQMKERKRERERERERGDAAPAARITTTALVAEIKIFPSV